MQVVIDIPEKYYEAIMELPPEQLCGDTVLIRYGTPLPKGHKDLIERDIGLSNFEIVMCNGDYRKGLKMVLDKIKDAPTIVEADEGGEQK